MEGSYVIQIKRMMSRACKNLLAVYTVPQADPQVL